MIHHQSVFDTWPIEDNSIQAIITSPPYWGLRKYDIPDVIIGGDKNCEHIFIEHFDPPKGGKCSSENPSKVGANNTMSDMDIRGVGIISSMCSKCGAWKGQYGLEPSYLDYIEHTRLWVKEAWRVLREDGILFLNVGDTYGTVSGSMGSGKYTDPKLSKEANEAQPKKQNINMHKCKLLIPHRIAIALIEDGWILRNDVLWVKLNAMPESVKDRFSKKYENIFMFVKNKKYYFDLDAVRTAYSIASLQRNKYLYQDRTGKDLGQLKGKDNTYKSIKANELGKNPGDVWGINTQPSSEPHYAMWPSKLVERMILCSTKEDDTVLDPFAGSATTLKIAIGNNRKALGIDLGYADIQERKLTNIQKCLL